MAQCMLHHSNLGHEFWAEAVATGNYICNRLPTVALTGMTPEEAWSGHKPSVAHLWIFGCLAFAHISKELGGGKFAARSVKCLFMGYSSRMKAYKLFDLVKKSMFNSRDVEFVERGQFGTSPANHGDAQEDPGCLPGVPDIFALSDHASDDVVDETRVSDQTLDQLVTCLVTILFRLMCLMCRPQG